MDRSPLQWPVGTPRTKNPTYSSFGGSNQKPDIGKASWYLVDQIRLLQGKSNSYEAEYIINSNLRYRQDGIPYANQRQPEDQGVAVYFPFNGEDIVIASDKYNKIGCNIWAVAKTIDNFRGIQRWGASDFLTRAFTGFKALPESAGEDSLGFDDWRGILDTGIDPTFEHVKKQFKKLATPWHPDKPDGDREMWDMFEAAYQQALKYFKNG